MREGGIKDKGDRARRGRTQPQALEWRWFYKYLAGMGMAYKEGASWASWRKSKPGCLTVCRLPWVGKPKELGENRQEDGEYPAGKLPAHGCCGNAEWAGCGLGGWGQGGSCLPTLASSTFSRSVSSDTLLQLRQPVGGRRLALGLGVPGSPWSPLAPVGGTEGADRHLMTPVHREEAAENNPSMADHACVFLPEQDQGPNSCSLCIQSDSFPVSQGRKSCCFPPRWGWPRLAGFGD